MRNNWLQLAIEKIILEEELKRPGTSFMLFRVFLTILSQFACSLSNLCERAFFVFAQQKVLSLSYTKSKCNNSN